MLHPVLRRVGRARDLDAGGGAVMLIAAMRSVPAPSTRLALGLLVLANAGAWIWAALAFGSVPGLLGMALLAWVFGLRHAIDADHVAAIDNAVRRLAAAQRPARFAGLHFSLGHSTIVILLALAVTLGAGVVPDDLGWLGAAGGIVGTIVSVVFLVLIAGANIAGLLAARRGTGEAAPTGPMSRLLQPAFRIVRRSRDMYLIGLLFGLGFDTATEIGLLALSAAGRAHGLALWQILAFPALFTAGMSVIDTADSALMTRAYGWAVRDGRRRRRYNLLLTAVSAAVALLVALIECVGLARRPATGLISHVFAALAAHWSMLGGAIAVLLLLLWLAGWRGAPAPVPGGDS